MSLRLFHTPATAAMVPHIVLEELGVPFERVPVDTGRGEHRAPAFLALNPNGHIPVLVDGDLVLYETAAIVLHLADTHPRAALAPALGTPGRAEFYKWLVWLANTVQATMMLYFYPERWVDAGNDAGMAQVQAHAHAKLCGCMEQLDALLAGHGGPPLLREAYSVLDPYAFTMGRWTRNFASGKARDLPHLGPYLRRVLARPAVQRVMAAEGIGEPFV